MLQQSWLRSIHQSLRPMTHRCFPLNSREARIQPIRRPHEFYDLLMQSISRAQDQISLAALYLGTGECERRLVLSLGDVLRKRPSVKVHLLFDGRRAFRKSKTGTSTMDLLQPLLANYGDRVTLDLFTLPAAQKAGKILPSPFDEVAGVFHMKAFACDEELLISGANLEQSYFTDRQDRYMYFGAAGDLAHYHHSLIHALGSMGARVTAKKSTSNAVTVTPAGPVSADEWSRRLKECTQLSQPRPVVYTTTTSEADTWVLPSLQCAPLGVHQDEEMTAELLKAVPDNSTLNLSTAYLNPTPPLIRALAEAAPTGRTNLLSAHPDSHGFKGARGLMAYVPLCYEHLLTQRVVPALRAARPGPSSCVNVLAYQRASWTFHAKGIWVFPKASENNVVSESEGAVTVVGSSNFGRRSSELDLECQMTILTESPELSAALKDEWSWLEERCAKPQDPVLEEGATTGSFGATSVMSSLMGKFL